jgi:hypothetical protein
LDRRRPGRAHTLLSHGNLSGAEREQLLDRVLAAVRERPPLWRRATVWAGTATALAGAAAFLIFARPASVERALRAKGEAAPIVRADCEPGGLEACRLGGTLMFAVEGTRPDARLAAWAEPVGGGERIWYFSGDGESPSVGDQTADSILRRGIRLGPEHHAGAYRLTVMVTAAPLPRAALLELVGGGGALAVRSWSLSVVP